MLRAISMCDVRLKTNASNIYTYRARQMLCGIGNIGRMNRPHGHLQIQNNLNIVSKFIW